eukprot:scaffold43208_cov74-Phaeocystis_antarctica.AAC.10
MASRSCPFAEAFSASVTSSRECSAPYRHPLLHSRSALPWCKRCGCALWRARQLRSHSRTEWYGVAASSPST